MDDASAQGDRSSPQLPPDPVYTFRPHSGGVGAVKYLSLGGSHGALASGTSSGQLSIWSLESKRQVWSNACSKPVLHIDTLPGNKLISQCREGDITIWNLETHQKEGSLSLNSPGFCRLSALGPSSTASEAQPPDSTSCFAVSDARYGKVDVYDIASRQLSTTLCATDSESKGMCMCVKAFHVPSGSCEVRLVGGFEDGSVLLWDIRNPARELSILKLFSEPIMCVDFDVRRNCGVCGSALKLLEVFSVNDTSQLEKRYSVELRNAGVADVSVRPDSRIMASGGWDGRIRVFGWKKGKALAVLNYHSSTVNCVDFAGCSAPLQDSNLLVCGSKDERITLWKLY